LKTYQDLLDVGEIERDRMEFVLSAIREHKASEAYQMAADAVLYASGKNATIMRYQKLLYTLTGKAVPDNYSANHKCASGFLKRFITQEAAYLLGNGVTFEGEDTKEKLGKNIDSVLYKGAKSALIQAVSFGFFNKDHVEMFDLTEFVPLYDEENGALMAGIRFWQIDDTKPLRATLFELDGYTDYVKRKDEEMSVLNEKRTYIQVIKSSEADGETIFDGKNYPNFPIVPLWANPEKQSELVGKREQIDCYDLIKSGFANDLDDASMIYWTITNAGGMDDVDLAKFLERMKIVKAATVDGDDGARAEAHTLDVPYQSREVYLSRLEKDLYKDAMALDTEQIAAGNVTATQIKAAYEALNEKTDEFEMCLHDFINGILAVAGIEDTATFTRSQIVNKQEEIETLITAAPYLGEEYVSEKILTLLGDIDRAEEIAQKIVSEETRRFSTLAGTKGE
jgi:SPP1 family phage portal protein